MTSINRAVTNDRAAKALGFSSQPECSDLHVFGSVKSINADGSYQVQLNTSSVTTRCAKLCNASVGDRVLVVIMRNGRAAAIARLGGDVDGDYLPVGGGEMHGAIVFDNNIFMFGKDSGGIGRSAFEPCTNDNRTTMGYGNYAAGQGRTNIYGNAVDIQSKSANINLYCDSGSVYVKGRILWAGTVIYANNSGSNGTITLTESAAKFSMLEIFYRTNDNQYHSARVYSPNGKTVNLLGAFFKYYSDGSNSVYIKVRDVAVRGTSIYTTGVAGEASINSNNSCDATQVVNVLIYKVVGYAY